MFGLNWRALPQLLLFKVGLVHRRRFTIIYKSGAKVHVRAHRISWKRPQNGDMTIEWQDMWPEVALIGVDDIAAIWAGWL